LKNYPPIDLSYLRALTDHTGIIQHGIYGLPNRRLGYTTDDNARALVVAVKRHERTRLPEDLELMTTYLSFLHHAHTPDHRFRNVMTYQRDFLDDEGTEDCYGRSIWACGVAASGDVPDNLRVVAKTMFEDSIVWAADLTSPRARAYSMMGMYEYLRGNEDEMDLRDKMDALADSLRAMLQEYSGDHWVWFEPYMTYGNAMLPLSMLLAGNVTGRKEYTDIARRTLDFLTETTIIGGRLEIIGNDGWYMRGGKRAWYDQQTIDGGYTVYAYCMAHSLLGDKTYLDHAFTSFDWFFGKNRSGQFVYDPESGGCRDAIVPGGVNENQGAEACVCFLLAQIAMQDHLNQPKEQTIGFERGLA